MYHIIQIVKVFLFVVNRNTANRISSNGLSNEEFLYRFQVWFLFIWLCLYLNLKRWTRIILPSGKHTMRKFDKQYMRTMMKWSALTNYQKWLYQKILTKLNRFLVDALKYTITLCVNSINAWTVIVPRNVERNIDAACSNDAMYIDYLATFIQYEMVKFRF